jgi:hypothetical protein
LYGWLIAVLIIFAGQALFCWHWLLRDGISLFGETFQRQLAGKAMNMTSFQPRLFAVRLC